MLLLAFNQPLVRQSLGARPLRRSRGLVEESRHCKVAYAGSGVLAHSGNTDMNFKDCLTSAMYDLDVKSSADKFQNEAQNRHIKRADAAVMSAKEALGDRGLKRRSIILQAAAACIFGGSQPSAALTGIVGESVISEGRSMSSLVRDGAKTWAWCPPGDTRMAAIRYFETGPAAGRPIVMIHGFGASAFQWRALMPILADKGYHVFALDLLGLGMSDKPSGFAYSMSCWQKQVEAFVEEVVGGSTQPFFIGNSLGSLIALNVVENSRGPVCLLNCGGGMNFKCVLKDGYNPAFKILSPLFTLSDVILQSPLLKLLFNSLATREKIREILSSGVYRNPSRVDDDLVESFYAPSQTPGALEAFESILTGDPGESPLTLAERLEDVQMLVLWGNEDTVTPFGGPVGQYFLELSRRRPSTVKFVELAGVGHCPMDDAPDMVEKYLSPWLEKLEREQTPQA